MHLEETPKTFRYLNTVNTVNQSLQVTTTLVTENIYIGHSLPVIHYPGIHSEQAKS